VERPPTEEPVGCCSVAGVCLPITKSALVGVLSVERRDGDGEGMVRKVGIWLARHRVCCCPGSFKVVMVGKEERKGDAPDRRIGPSKTRVATLGSQ